LTRLKLDVRVRESIRRARSAYCQPCKEPGEARDDWRQASLLHELAVEVAGHRLCPPPRPAVAARRVIAAPTATLHNDDNQEEPNDKLRGDRGSLERVRAFRLTRVRDLSRNLTLPRPVVMGSGLADSPLHT